MTSQIKGKPRSLEPNTNVDWISRSLDPEDAALVKIEKERKAQRNLFMKVLRVLCPNLTDDP